jgi:hypothetical protein
MHIIGFGGFNKDMAAQPGVTCRSTVTTPATSATFAGRPVGQRWRQKQMTTTGRSACAAVATAAAISATSAISGAGVDFQ